MLYIINLCMYIDLSLVAFCSYSNADIMVYIKKETPRPGKEPLEHGIIFLI